MGDRSQEVRDSIDDVAKMQNFAPEMIVREAALGPQFSFAGALPIAEALVDLYKLVPLQLLVELPPGPLQQLSGRAIKDFAQLQQLLQFDPTSDRNAPGLHKSLISNLLQCHNESFPVISNVLAVVSRMQQVSGTEKQELEGMLAHMRSVMDTEIAKIKDKAKSGEAALDALRGMAADSAVGAQADHFEKEAETHTKMAGWWLATTIVLSAVMLVAIYISYKHYPPSDRASTLVNVHTAVNKALVLAVISFGILFSSRSYRAHRHNAVLNRHRRNALRTYRTMVEGSTGDKQGIILSTLATCIFSPQDTGYNKPGGGEAPTAKSVFELVGGIAQPPT